eukprot:9500930-Pyramimonas_sp.AAC.1
MAGRPRAGLRYGPSANEDSRGGAGGAANISNVYSVVILQHPVFSSALLSHIPFIPPRFCRPSASSLIRLQVW